MTIIVRIFQKVAELSIPHFFITVEFPAIGNEMPERIETFLWEKYRAILRGASVANLSIQKESGVLFSLSFLQTKSWMSDMH